MRKFKNLLKVFLFLGILASPFISHTTLAQTIGDCKLTTPGSSINCATSSSDLTIQSLLNNFLNLISGSQLPVPVPIQGNQSIDCSTTVSTTAINLCGGQVPTNSYEICNPNASGDLWFSDTTTAVVNGVGSTPLLNTNPNKCYEIPVTANPKNAVSIVGSASNLKVTARIVSTVTCVNINGICYSMVGPFINTPSLLSTSLGNNIRFSFIFNSITRYAYVHLPTGYSTSNTYPAILVFHGNGGSAPGMVNNTGLNSIADANGFIVFYIESNGTSWTVNTSVTGDPYFTLQITQQLVSAFSVNTSKISLAGFSEGGGMAEVLGQCSGSNYASVSIVAHNLSPNYATVCPSAIPKTYVLFHGTGDNISYFNGGNYNGTNTLSAPQTAQAWVSINGCSPTTSTDTNIPDVINFGISKQNVTSIDHEWSTCNNGTTVSFYEITNGGHNWPGGGMQANPNNGISQNIIASSIIWQKIQNKTN
jgi:polyhydroxybutyrate depolymerase